MEHDNSPWLIRGGYNTIVQAEEKRGDQPFNFSEIFDFITFVQDVQVHDVGFSSYLLTWCNNCQGRAKVSVC